MPIRPRNRRRRITECRSESSRLEPLPRGLAGSGTISPPLSVTATPHERHTARPTPRPGLQAGPEARERSEEHTSELQSLMRNSYAVFCLKKKKTTRMNMHITKHNLKNTIYEIQHNKAIIILTQKH